jgi:hypothetical protein
MIETLDSPDMNVASTGSRTSNRSARAVLTLFGLKLRPKFKLQKYLKWFDYLLNFPGWSVLIFCVIKYRLETNFHNSSLKLNFV